MAAITDLSTASTVAAANYLVISQSGTDKKLAASTLYPPLSPYSVTWGAAAFAANTDYTAITAGELTTNAAYIVTIAFNANGGGSPYVANATLPFCPPVVNGAFDGDLIALPGAAHVAAITISVRYYGAAGNVAAGLKVRTNATWPAATTFTVTAYRIA